MHNRAIRLPLTASQEAHEGVRERKANHKKSGNKRKGREEKLKGYDKEDGERKRKERAEREKRERCVSGQRERERQGRTTVVAARL